MKLVGVPTPNLLTRLNKRCKALGSFTKLIMYALEFTDGFPQGTTTDLVILCFGKYNRERFQIPTIV